MHAWESIQFGVGRAQAAEAFSQEWAVSSSSSWFLAAIISCSSGGRIKDAIVSFVTTTLPLGLSFICCNGSGEKRSAIQFSTKMTITKDDVYRAIIKKKKKKSSSPAYSTIVLLIVVPFLTALFGSVLFSAVSVQERAV